MVAIRVFVRGSIVTRGRSGRSPFVGVAQGYNITYKGQAKPATIALGLPSIVSVFSHKGPFDEGGITIWAVTMAN